MKQKMAYGSYTGNGSPMVLGLGFVPVFGCVFNETDGDQFEFFMKGIPAGSSITPYVPAANAADAFTELDGEAAMTALTGTVALADGTTAITGTSTEFETELQVGDVIKVNDQFVTIASITSDTAAVAVLPSNGAEATSPSYRTNGRPAGIALGTDLTEDGKVFDYWFIG